MDTFLEGTDLAEMIKFLISRPLTNRSTLISVKQLMGSAPFEEFDEQGLRSYPTLIWKQAIVAI